MRAQLEELQQEPPQAKTQQVVAAALLKCRTQYESQLLDQKIKLRSKLIAAVESLEQKHQQASRCDCHRELQRQERQFAARVDALRLEYDRRIQALQQHVQELQQANSELRRVARTDCVEPKLNSYLLK